MTDKLYWTDSHLTTFTTRILAATEQAGRPALALEATAFYPEGGGQPCDLGTLNGIPVQAVTLAEDGRILHTVAEASGFTPGAGVRGEIDAARRREHTQQHTGQHLLSQAFFQLHGAETKGFRILDDVTQIDLTLDAPADTVPAALRQAEDLANQIVFENRAIRTHELSPDEAAKLPLRKESFITDCIRVVEIDEYDWSPCGGTHAQNTGEVGLIAVRGWERAKQMVRVEFVCGVRALRDYRVTNQLSGELARRFTIGRGEVLDAVARLQDESKTWQRRARALAAIAAQVEADRLLANVTETNGLRVVTQVFDDRDFEEAKLIAHRLVAAPRVVALLAVREAAMARLVFARSADVAADMNALLKTTCEHLGGRGGGKPDFAQGGGARVAALDEALAMARARLPS